LKELRDFQASSKELANMQMLKQSRLSVSKVTKEEWDFLMDKVNKNEAKED
jgi:predicted RNA-binding protein with PUA-like domain